MEFKEIKGEVFYRVEYQGRFTRYEIINIKDGVPVYSLTALATIKDDVWKLIDNPKTLGTSNFPVSVMKEKPVEFFTEFDEAKNKSLERFEDEVNPNGDYKVSRYFDDIFEADVTDVLTKKEAAIECKKFNDAKPRHYVQYRIRPIKPTK